VRAALVDAFPAKAVPFISYKELFIDHLVMVVKVDLDTTM
jgi:hypothetical protein